jgi:hypothetical protein
LKTFETVIMGYSGAWEKLIHEKKPDVENLVAKGSSVKSGRSS